LRDDDDDGVHQDVGLPNTKGAGLVVATQALRAEGYKNYTTILAKLPYVIGFHWFEWFDEPVEGRALDGENSNYGLVNINGKPDCLPPPYMHLMLNWWWRR
jgi:agarase